MFEALKGNLLYEVHSLEAENFLCAVETQVAVVNQILVEISYWSAEWEIALRTTGSLAVSQRFHCYLEHSTACEAAVETMRLQRQAHAEILSPIANYDAFSLVE